jgi:hypothetical protein
MTAASRSKISSINALAFVSAEGSVISTYHRWIGSMLTALTAMLNFTPGPQE